MQPANCCTPFHRTMLNLLNNSTPRYLFFKAKGDQKYWRSRLQKAYQRPTYEEAKRELKKIRQELNDINESAVASLDEGFEETLTCTGWVCLDCSADH